MAYTQKILRTFKTEMMDIRRHPYHFMEEYRETYSEDVSSLVFSDRGYLNSSFDLLVDAMTEIADCGLANGIRRFADEGYGKPYFHPLTAEDAARLLQIAGPPSSRLRRDDAYGYSKVVTDTLERWCGSHPDRPLKIFLSVNRRAVHLNDILLMDSLPAGTELYCAEDIVRRTAPAWRELCCSRMLAATAKELHTAIFILRDIMERNAYWVKCLLQESIGFNPVPPEPGATILRTRLHRTLDERLAEPFIEYETLMMDFPRAGLTTVRLHHTDDKYPLTLRRLFHDVANVACANAADVNDSRQEDFTYYEEGDEVPAILRRRLDADDLPLITYCPYMLPEYRNYYDILQGIAYTIVPGLVNAFADIAFRLSFALHAMPDMDIKGLLSQEE